MLRTEYKRQPCYYCGKQTLRKKGDADWKPGDELSIGREEPANTYWICDSCKRTQCSLKGAVITSTMVTVGQYYLWHFLR